MGVMEAIEKDGMGPYYTHVCELLGWKEDSSKRAELDAQVEAKLAEIDGQIAEAEKSEGDVEVRDHMVSRALALAAAGDVERTLEAIDVVLEKTVGAGPKLDLAFLKIRMGLFYLDHERLSVFLADADELAEAGGDWERRNRLKAYTAVYSMSIRKFDRAAELFLETMATFTSYELTPFVQYIRYAVVMGVLSLPRTELKEKLMGPPTCSLSSASWELPGSCWSRCTSAGTQTFSLRWLRLAMTLVPTGSCRTKETTIAARCASGRTTRFSRRTGLSRLHRWRPSLASPRPLSTASSPALLPRAASRAPSTPSRAPSTPLAPTRATSCTRTPSRPETSS